MTREVLGRAADERRYLDRRAVSGYLGLSIRCVDSLIAARELKAIRVGKRVLVDRQDADAFMAAHKAA